MKIMIKHDKTIISTTSVILILITILIISSMLLFSESGKKLINGCIKSKSITISEKRINQSNINSDNATNTITYK